MRVVRVFIGGFGGFLGLAQLRGVCGSVLCRPSEAGSVCVDAHPWSRGIPVTSDVIDIRYERFERCRPR